MPRLSDDLPIPPHIAAYLREAYVGPPAGPPSVSLNLPLTHAEHYGRNGDLALVQGRSGRVTVFTGDNALARKLTDAINAVMAEHNGFSEADPVRQAEAA